MKTVLTELKNAKRIVVKVGTSTLTYENGRLNLRRIDKLSRVISDLCHQGREVVLVSSGAIGAGVGKLGLRSRPTKTQEKQACAAVGQCELMNIYNKLFGEYGQKVAQILLTKDVLDEDHREENAVNTFQSLLDWGVVPIVNENDTISIDELIPTGFGENDNLSAMVARLIGADCLIILSDIDGLYDANPNEDINAHMVDYVQEVNDQVYEMAGGSGSNRGTGGMITKLKAAKLVTDAGIHMVIASGEDPKVLYDILDGYHRGTVFIGKEVAHD